jgi:hypothetical protein
MERKRSCCHELTTEPCLTYTFFNIYFNIIFSISLSAFLTKILYAFIISPRFLHAPRISSSLTLLIICSEEEKLWSLTLCNFLCPLYIFCLRSKYSSQHFVFKHCQSGLIIRNICYGFLLLKEVAGARLSLEFSEYWTYLLPAYN